MWSRLGAGTVLLAGMLVLSAPSTAFAEDPVDLGGAYVIDTVGALSGDESRVIDALDTLYERADIQLFVVYVDTFTGETDATAWADATAIDNGLGVNDILLAVAIDDRQYALSIDQEFPLSDAQLTRVESAIEGQLVNDEWAEAAIIGAQTIEAEATGVVGPNQPEVPVEPAEPAPSDGVNLVLPIVGGVAVVGVGVFIFSRIRKRNQDGSVTAVPERMTHKQLDQRAGTLLVQLDDSLKTSEQELGFAVAQFGEKSTKEFTAALESAKAKVSEAFSIKQKLDDAVPETAGEKRAWMTQIIQLCEAADAELDAQADAFDELRQLEKNAPTALVDVRELAATTSERLTTAKEKLDTLEKTYAAVAVKSVATNVDQAEKLLTFANSAAAKADEAITAGNASEAAIAVRSAQASVGQANQLFDAIDSLSADLATAAEKLSAVVADTTTDLAAARDLPLSPEMPPLSPMIAAAESALAAATADKPDPLGTLAGIEKANAELEKAMVGVRDQQEKLTRAKAQIEGSITAARAQVAAAMEFITTRRGGIGSLARTRLSEADRRLAQAVALAATDPIAALEEAQQANSLASSALSMARSDVDAFTQREQYDSGFVEGSDGADLGGILGDLFGGGFGGGGSSRSSSSGGGLFGGSSRGGSSYRPSRSSRSGSFGGSSRSSSRSGGSRSSGGGRSRGGRF
ncbi:TPM domain-containing protein [soil metagenome]